MQHLVHPSEALFKGHSFCSHFSRFPFWPGQSPLGETHDGTQADMKNMCTLSFLCLAGTFGPEILPLNAAVSAWEGITPSV